MRRCLSIALTISLASMPGQGALAAPAAPAAEVSVAATPAPAAAASAQTPAAPASTSAAEAAPAEEPFVPAVGAVVLNPPPAPVLPGQAPVAKDGADEDPGPILPDEPRYGDKPMTGRGQIWAGIVAGGGGVVALTASLLMTTCDYNSALGCRFGQSRPVTVAGSASIIATGAVLIVGGLAHRYRYHRWQEDVARIRAKYAADRKASAMVVPYLAPALGTKSAHAGLALSGRF